MPLSSDQTELVAAAILAVNRFPLRRSQEVVAELRRRSLLNPEYVRSLDLGRLTVELANAGYDRGMLTSMFAERLQFFMKAISDGVLDELGKAVESGDEALARRVLTAVKGIGPRVARTAWVLLRTIASKDHEP